MRESKEAVENCLGCMPAQETKKDLGGSVWEGEYWRVSHCNGPFGEGTMVVEPKRHIARIENLTKDEEMEMIPVFRDVSEAVRESTDAERVYIEHWTHSPTAHAHWLFIPVTSKLIEEHGGKKGPALIAAMLEKKEPLDKQKAAELSGEVGKRIADYRESRDRRVKEMWLAIAKQGPPAQRASGPEGGV